MRVAGLIVPDLALRGCSITVPGLARRLSISCRKRQRLSSFTAVVRLEVQQVVKRSIVHLSIHFDVKVWHYSMTPRLIRESYKDLFKLSEFTQPCLTLTKRELLCVKCQLHDTWFVVTSNWNQKEKNLNADHSFLSIARRREVTHTAFKAAVVVGTILCFINQGPDIVNKEMTIANGVQMLFTYLVPYCVSTYSSVKMIRKYTDTREYWAWALSHFTSNSDWKKRNLTFTKFQVSDLLVVSISGYLKNHSQSKLNQWKSLLLLF